MILVADILQRLTQARRNAGLSLSQAGRLSELGSSGVMLIEEGDKWTNVAEGELPVPPPAK